MIDPEDRYPSQPLKSITENPVATAKFKEPVFKLGVFQDRFIEVIVTVYPLSVASKSGATLVGVQFGVMPVVRFVDKDLLYDVTPLEVE